MLNSEKVIEKFKANNSHRIVTTLEPIIKDINPQQIIGINFPHEYPEILKDCKMDKLKKSYELHGWIDKMPHTLDLLEFPDGTFVVNGNGNHRAVLAKEKSLNRIKANVLKVVFED